MVVLDGNFALDCGPGTDYPQIHTFQCMLEGADAITNEVLETITFVLGYPTVFIQGHAATFRRPSNPNNKHNT